MADNGTIALEQAKKSGPVNVSPTGGSGAPGESMDEFFNQLQSEMRRPDLSQDAVAAAFEAIQQMAMDGDAEKPMAAGAGADAQCPGCGAENTPGGRFCASCGSPLQAAPAGKADSGQHHYHHHYHHHYFPTGAPAASPQAGRPVPVPGGTRQPVPVRAPLATTGLSRAEAALRKVSQDWVQACNTKHLDDMLELYAADALVLRPNVPAVRGTAAVREFFFGALDAGLGEVELEPLRVDMFADVAYEAGRCKMLTPVSMGKRREERGKYMIIFHRQGPNEWKIVADCWSSDLSLAAPEPTESKPPRKTG